MTKAIKIKNINLGSGIPKICVPLTGKTREDLYIEAENAKAAAPDIVEWRADAYEDIYKETVLLETLKGITDIMVEIPVLFTIRTSHEGGPIDITEEDYEKINLLAAKSGDASIIDVEVFWEKEKKVNLIHKLQQTGVIVIASSHDFAKTDSADILKERFLEMDTTGADVLKMAVMPQNFEDVLAILNVTHDMVTNVTEKPVISMSMGHLGAVSRVSGELSGSALTFGTVGAASAPGQIAIESLREIMKVLH